MIIAASCWLRRVMLRSSMFAIVCLLIGAGMMWFAFNLTAGPGAIVIPEGEAEGQAFSDPDTIDLVSHVIKRRDCAGQSQRYAWRWETYNGKKTQHIIPLAGTLVPFLAETGEVMITVSSRDVPDRLQKNAGWKYRVVTEPRCAVLPDWAGRWFGPHLVRSPDLPLNFIGAKHE